MALLTNKKMGSGIPVANSSSNYDSLYEQYGKQYKVDPTLLKAQGYAESDFNPNAVGPMTKYGQAEGIAQFIPSTAKSMGISDPKDPKQAIEGQARLMAENIERYGTDADALNAYHGGTDKSNWGPKTKTYSEKVIKEYNKLKSETSGNKVSDARKEITDPALLAQLNAPDTSARKEVTDPAILAQLNGGQSKTESPPGFGQRVVDDITKRANEGADAIVAYRNNEQGLPATALDLAGKMGAGTIGDIMKEGGKGIADTIPKGIKDIASTIEGYTPIGTIKSAGKAILNTDIGKAGVKAAQQGKEAYDSWAKNNPNAARHVEAAVDIAALLPGGKATSEAAPYLGEGAEALVKGAGKSAEAMAAPAKVLKEGFDARTPEVLDKVTAKMNEQGDMAFKAMRKAGVRIIPEKSQQIADSIESELATETGKNDPALHQGTLKVLNDMKKKAFKGFDIEDLHIYQKRLAQVINKNSIAGGNKEDAMKATIAKDLIDEHLTSLKSSDIPHEALNAINQLHAGKAVWAQMRAFETIADIVKKSDGDPNRMKNLFEQLKNNPRKMRGFNNEDKALINEAARNSTPETLMKMLGKFGVDLGSIRAAASGSALPIFTEVLSGKYGHPIAGTALTAAGTAAKYGQKLTARAKAERVLKNIENRKTAPSTIEDAVQGQENPVMKAIGQQ